MIFGAVGMWISGLSLQTKSIEAQFIICTVSKKNNLLTLFTNCVYRYLIEYVQVGGTIFVF